jgi:hypothetical protein
MKLRRVIIGLAMVVSAVGAWFLCVDWSWFEEACPHCGYGRSIAQRRILGIVIHERAFEYPTVMQRVAADLGVPCEHPELHRWHKHRWWGLCYCAAPCINGVYRITGDDSWYDAAALEKLQELAKANPEFRRDFFQRVIREHDRDYWLEIISLISPEDKIN